MPIMPTSMSQQESNHHHQQSQQPLQSMMPMSAAAAGNRADNQPSPQEVDKFQHQQQQHVTMPGMPTMMPMASSTTSNMVMPGYNLNESGGGVSLHQPSIPMPTNSGNTNAGGINAMLQNAFLMSNMNGNNQASTTSSVIPLTITKTQDEAIDENHIKVLQKDFDELSKMTLIDSEEYLYNLFIRKDAFNQQNYMCNLLFRLYQEKYSHLFSKYRGIGNWLLFCLTMMIYKTENNLKLECRYSNSSNLMLGNHPSFLLKSRKRNSNNQNFIRTEKVKKAKIVVKHPLLLESYYIEHENLFNIGFMSRYCIPSDFAIMHMHTSQSNVVKIITKMDKRTVMGLKGSFSKPVVCAMEHREIKQYKFYNASNMEDVTDVISKMTNLQIEFNMFNFGIKEQKKIYNITKDSTQMSTLPNDKDLKDTSCYFALIANFQCVCKTSKFIDIRAYVDTLYEISRDLEMNSAKIEIIDEMIQNNTERLEECLDKYYEEVEKLKNPVETNVSDENVAIVNGSGGNVSTVVATVEMAADQATADSAATTLKENDDHSVVGDITTAL